MYFLTLWNARGCQDTRSELSSGHMFCQGACLFVTYAYKAFFTFQSHAFFVLSSLLVTYSVSYFIRYENSQRNFGGCLPNRLLASIYVTTIIFTIFNLATYVRLNEIYTLSSLFFFIVVINVHCCFFYILTFKFTCLTSLFGRLMTINKMSVHSPDSIVGV